MMSMASGFFSATYRSPPQPPPAPLLIEPLVIEPEPTTKEDPTLSIVDPLDWVVALPAPAPLPEPFAPAPKVSSPGGAPQPPKVVRDTAPPSSNKIPEASRNRVIDPRASGHIGTKTHGGVNGCLGVPA